jgi:hypothetical protein
MTSSFQQMFCRKGHCAPEASAVVTDLVLTAGGQGKAT